jgi:hypothetical protein
VWVDPVGVWSNLHEIEAVGVFGHYAFPHQTIYFGKDKKGRSPALNVEMEKTA